MRAHDLTAIDDRGPCAAWTGSDVEPRREPLRPPLRRRPMGPRDEGSRVDAIPRFLMEFPDSRYATDVDLADLADLVDTVPVDRIHATSGEDPCATVEAECGVALEEEHLEPLLPVAQQDDGGRSRR